LRVTAPVRRFINHVTQYEKCDPAPQAKSRFQRETLNCEPDNLSSYNVHNRRVALWDL